MAIPTMCRWEEELHGCHCLKAGIRHTWCSLAVDLGKQGNTKGQARRRHADETITRGRLVHEVVAPGLFGSCIKRWVRLGIAWVNERSLGPVYVSVVHRLLVTYIWYYQG